MKTEQQIVIKKKQKKDEVKKIMLTRKENQEAYLYGYVDALKWVLEEKWT